MTEKKQDKGKGMVEKPITPVEMEAATKFIAYLRRRREREIEALMKEIQAHPLFGKLFEAIRLGDNKLIAGAMLEIMAHRGIERKRLWT